MSRVCTVCGKKPGYGNNRSHSNRATRRRFNPNLQKIRIVENGTPIRAYVCAKCISAGKVQKVAVGKMSVAGESSEAGKTGEAGKSGEAIKEAV